MPEGMLEGRSTSTEQAISSIFAISFFGEDWSDMKLNSSQDTSFSKALKLKKLTPEQVKHIDEVLASLGDYGEVHLIMQHGELRYINKVESFNARKNEPKE